MYIVVIEWECLVCNGKLYSNLGEKNGANKAPRLHETFAMF